MNNSTDNNRNLIFIGITILVGIVIIGGVMTLEMMDVPNDRSIDNSPKSNSNVIVKRIDSIQIKSFDPSNLSTIKSEIGSSHNAGLVTGLQKSLLEKKLEEEYSNRLFKECEKILKSASDETNKISGWIADFENQTSASAKTIYYKQQAMALKYYTKALPLKINDFVNDPDFKDSQHFSLKEELNSMPKLDAKYQKSNTILSLKMKLKNVLEENINNKFKDTVNPNI